MPRAQRLALVERADGVEADDGRAWPTLAAALAALRREGWRLLAATALGDDRRRYALARPAPR